MLGKFYGIGVGPGSTDLLTVRATNVLRQIDVVCLPRSGPDNSRIAFRIVEPLVSNGCEIVEIPTPMTRDKQLLEQAWEEGADIIAEKLRNGKNVAFITIGDSTLFSTYTYLKGKIINRLPDLPVESIPGITSFSAVTSYLNVALAEGNERVAIIPAIDNIDELRYIFSLFSNVVLLKVAGKYDEIVSLLEELKLKDRSVFVSKLGHADEFITFDLDEVRNRKREYLSLILVKKEGF